MEGASADDGLALEDRVCLTALNHVQVRSWTSSRIEEYKARIRALSLVHNSAAPINHYLPPEVLTHIFGYLHPKSFRQLQYLHVCRRWRALMLRTPSYWANFLSSVFLNMEHLNASRSQRFEFFLRHSSPRPFDITLRGCPAPVSEALAPHAHRVRTMKLSIEALDVTHLDRLLVVGMPLLESLSVKQLQQPARKVGERNELFATPIHLDASKYPRLHTLQIPRSLFTTENAVPTIRDLELTACNCTDCVNTRTHTLTPLLDALEQCPALETLRIKNSLPPHDTSPPPAIDRMVGLPALRTLHIEDVGPRTSKFLSHIDYPTLALVTIAGVRAWRDPMFKGSLPPDLTRFRPIADATKVSLKVRGTFGVFETYAGESKLLSLQITDGEFEERHFRNKAQAMPYVSELADIFAFSSTLTTLKVSVGAGTFLRVDWTRLLAALPNLLSLDTEGCEGLYAILPSLRPDHTTGDCLCPALEELSFFWGYGSHLCCHQDDDIAHIRTTVGKMLPQGSSENMTSNWEPKRSVWKSEKWHPSYPAVTFLGYLVATVLKKRPRSLKVLSISIPRRGSHDGDGTWTTEELQEKLTKGRLGRLVGRINVMYSLR